jgi:carboxyl-terminal processing protease
MLSPSWLSLSHPCSLMPLLRRAALTLALLPATSGLLQAQPAQNLPLPVDEVRLFTEAFDAIRSAYVNEIDDRTLLEYAIRGMLSGLDPHSAFLDEDEYDTLQESTQGEFGGLGIEVGEENGYIKVISPIDGTPADRAGIMPGDLIIEIDGRPVRESTVNEAVERLRGDIGSDVVLTLMRDDEQQPFDVTLTREVITATSVRHRELEPGFGYIRISQFRTNTGAEVLRALNSLRQEQDKLHGLVLDLRSNPGGVLQASVEVADVFLDGGRVVYTDGRLSEAEVDYHANSNDPSEGVPMVVLINSGSASAAEIVAGALQDHGRAVIMGTQSFGKGSVQTVLPLRSNRAIKLTTSLYYTPLGRSIQAQGITPDIEVEQGLVTRASRQRGIYTEADLGNHLRGNGDEQPLPRTRVSTEPVIVSDYQLNEALTLLKGWHIMDQGRQRRNDAH